MNNWYVLLSDLTDDDVEKLGDALLTKNPDAAGRFFEDNCLGFYDEWLDFGNESNAILANATRLTRDEAMKRMGVGV